MNICYDVVRLNYRFGEYHLINFNEEDLGSIVFSVSLPNEDSCVKIKAFIDDVIQDGYLNLESIPDALIDIDLDLLYISDREDVLYNSRIINDLALDRLLLTKEDKNNLYSLMHLGIKPKEYEFDRLNVANRIFEGCSLKYKIDSYISFLRLAQTEEEKKILKNLIKEILISEINKRPEVFFKAPADLKDDKDLALVAVTKNGMMVAHLSETLKNDREIVLAAVKQNGEAIIYASKELREDRNIALNAVRQNGEVIRHIEGDLKNDREIVLSAVRQNGLSIWLMPDFQDDEEVVIEAVKQDGLAIRYVSLSLQNNKNIISLASIKIFSDFLKKTNLTKSSDLEISFDEITRLVNFYKFSNIEHQSYNKDADKYIKCLIENKVDKAIDSVDNIKTKIGQGKEKYFLDVISNLELEAYYLRSLGLKDPKILRIIYLLVKEVISYRNKGIKFYLYSIFESFVNEELINFLEKLLIISNGKTNLILPSIILSSLNIDNASQIKLYKILNTKSSVFKNHTNPLLQSIIFLEQVIKNNEEKIDHYKIVFFIEKIFECTGEIDDYEIIIRSNLFKVILNINLELIKSIENFSSNYLFQLIVRPLIEIGVLNDNQKDKEMFIDVFIKSRIPDAIFVYVNSFITDSDSFIMIPVIKKFIDSLINKRYLDDRHKNNTYGHLLNEKQKLEWESGKTELLDFSKSIEIVFNSEEFLRIKLINDNHDKGKLDNIKKIIEFGSMIEKPNQVESLCIELLLKNDPKDQLEILQRLQLALDLSIEYEGVEFKNDVKSQISLMKKVIRPDINWKIKDTEDWQDLFFCGTEVIGSCQRIDGSTDLNKCLLGYVLDGKVRMIKISGEDEVTIARSIIKIMEDPFGKPALFLERTYPNDQYYPNILEFAKKRAKSLEIDLYEYNLLGSIILESKGNTAPYEYEDAGCNGVTTGIYKISVKLI